MDRIAIDRILGTCLVPRNHPAPERLRYQMEDALDPSRLTPALARAMDGLQVPDEGIWFIRRLDLDLAVGMHRMESGVLADLVARRLAGNLQSLLNDSAGNPDVIFFPNRPAFTAQFVTDLADGRGWDRWYYTSFSGLSSLMPHQALREAILREPDLVEDVLAELSKKSRLDRVLNLLTAQDMQRIYAACRALDGPDAAPSRPVAEKLLALVPRIALASEWTSPENYLRLRLAWHAAGGERNPSLHATIRLLLDFASLLENLAGLQAVLARDERPISHGPLSPGRRATLEAVDRMAGADRGWLAQAARVLNSDLSDEPVPSSAGWRAAQLAGIFLVLAAQPRPNLAGILDRYAPDPETAAVWRCWFFLKCMGQAHPGGLQADPAILAAAGLVKPPDPQEAARAESAGAGVLADLTAGFRQALQEQALVAGHLLALERLENVVVVRDMQADYWLACGDSEKAEEMLAVLAQDLQQPAALVWDTEGPAPAGVPDEFAARRKPAAAVWDFLAGGSPASDFDMVLTLMAQALLRSFARRMFGFAWSSPRHLFENFLAGRGAVQLRPQEILVKAPRPPLHQILGMAGLGAAPFAFPWQPDRQVILLPPGGPER